MSFFKELFFTRLARHKIIFIRCADDLTAVELVDYLNTRADFHLHTDAGSETWGDYNSALNGALIASIEENKPLLIVSDKPSPSYSAAAEIACYAEPLNLDDALFGLGARGVKVIIEKLRGELLEYRDPEECIVIRIK